MRLSIIGKLTLQCNLDCSYCYEKKDSSVMSKEILKAIIVKSIEYNLANTDDGQPGALFYWHGGEPLLAGKKTFETIYEIQEPFKKVLPIKNAIQTNGTLLNDDWFKWLKTHDQGYGLSIDGPRELHDANRYFNDKSGSFDMTLAAIKRHAKYFGGKKPVAICVVTKNHIGKEMELLEFFEKYTSEFSMLPYFPTDPDRDEKYAPDPTEYGHFLIRLFDIWNSGKYEVIINNFKNTMEGLILKNTPDCCTQRDCTETLFSVEPDGYIYPCDRFPSSPENRIGNILEDSIQSIFENKRKLGFDLREKSLSSKCMSCKWKEKCYGGCIYNGYARTKDYTAPDYYCEAYYMLFEHLSMFIDEELSAAEIKS